MQIKIYTIDFQLDLGTKLFLKYVGVPALIVAGATALAWADPVTVTNTFQDGDTLSAAKMNQNFQDVLDGLNDVNPPCPRDYMQESDNGVAICRKHDDEIVKVGTGASAFWIDRYEASIWDDFAMPTTSYGSVACDDYPGSFPPNGQWTSPAYAISKGDVLPSGCATWFRANEACRASGKRLPTGSEWLAAARGTSDPGSSSGAGGLCVTSTALRATGGGTACRSAWGAEDMIGNMWEWTADWEASPQLSINNVSAQWPAAYGSDTVFGVESYASDGMGNVQGLPAAAMRGGAWNDGTGAGIFTLRVNYAPLSGDVLFGFRCVM